MLHRFFLHIFSGVSRRIYLDYASATPVDGDVLKAMRPYERKVFGNPSSIHKEGVEAQKALFDARERVARSLSVRSEEVLFTSGGTEANNLAIRGAISAVLKTGRKYEEMHIITSSIEHSSVLECTRLLESLGVSVSYLAVDEKGNINSDDILKSIRPETVLISLSYINNEIGTIAPLREISKKLQAQRNGAEKGVYPLFHTDASQAPLFLNCSPESLGVDLMTIDSQKIYGPKGVGMLFSRHNVPLEPILYGGGQESGLRSGTEPISLIVGFSVALIKAQKEYKELNTRIGRLRELFFKELKSAVPNAEVNGDRKRRVANNINVSIPGVLGEFLVIQMDEAGVSAGTASACLSRIGAVSYVIEALGKGKDRAESSIRFTLGKETTAYDIRKAIALLKDALKS